MTVPLYNMTLKCAKCGVISSPDVSSTATSNAMLVWLIIYQLFYDASFFWPSLSHVLSLSLSLSLALSLSLSHTHTHRALWPVNTLTHLDTHECRHTHTHT